ILRSRASAGAGARRPRRPLRARAGASSAYLLGAYLLGAYVLGRRWYRGQRDAYPGTPPARAVDGDVAAVQVHDALDDRHAEAGPRGLGGEERHEDLVAMLGSDPDARVADLDHGAIVADREVDLDPPPAGLRVDGLHRVLDHVGEHLAKL